MIHYRLHPEAEAEIEVTATVYASRQSGLGASFVAAVNRAVSFLRTYPEAGAPIGDSFRRVRVRGFPYAIIYRLETEGAFILAVAHTSRRPGYWLHRA